MIGAKIGHRFWCPVDSKSRERALEEALRRARHALIQTVHVVSAVAGRRDRYTSRHQRRTATLAVAIGRELGLSAQSLEGLYLGALVHDLGKVAIPFELLGKPSRLTAEEFALVKTHVQVVCDILENVDLPWPVHTIVAQHHERLDGTGYPSGLTAGAIAEEARIVAVADVFQAMSDNRPARTGAYKDSPAAVRAASPAGCHGRCPWPPWFASSGLYRRCLPRRTPATS